jgi:AMP-binding enzyme
LTAASSYDPPRTTGAPSIPDPAGGLAMQRNSMRDLDPTCGGLLPLIASLEPAPAVRDDRGDAWMTRGEVRAASLTLAEGIASDRKRLVFLFCGNSCETVIGLLAAAAAGHAVALIDPSLARDKLSALIEAYEPDLVVATPDVGEKLREGPLAWGDWRSHGSALNAPPGKLERHGSTSIPHCRCFFPPQARPAARNMCGCRAARSSLTRRRSPRRWSSTIAAPA